MSILFARGALPFPCSLPDFQHLFPDAAACAAYLEHARWGEGFVCRLHRYYGCLVFRSYFRPLWVLHCRPCRCDTSLTV